MTPALVGFELLREELLALVAIAPVIALFGAAAIARRRRERAALASPPFLPRLFAEDAPARSVARVALAGAAALFLALALSGPVRGFTMREVVQRGFDVVVCIDTSRSMLAQDVRPSRLDRARREVRGLLSRLEGDRAALIAFAGDAREVAPLTHDRSTLATILDTLDPLDNQVGGTDLGGAIERALALFDERSGAHEAIVLLTDGEDHSGNGRAMAERAAEHGIRVYVVGVGTEAGSKIPVTGPDGRSTFLEDEAGEEVITRLEGASLQALAEATGGEYLSTEQSPTPLEDLFEHRISRLERRRLQDGRERVPHDRYQWSLALALACMIGELGLREGRRGRGRGARR